MASKQNGETEALGVEAGGYVLTGPPSLLSGSS